MPQGLHLEKVRFGVFEADLRAGELRKYGLRIRLQRQPFKILAALIERPGELVTREDLRQLIWGPEVVVDFDHSLGTAINKLREALGDSAETPHFIETLAKRGFRFIAPVELIGAPPQPTPEKPTLPANPALDLEELPTPRPQLTGVAPLVTPAAAPRSLALVVAWSTAAALALALAWLWLSEGSRSPTAVQFSQITSDYRIYPGQMDIERFPGTATDGVRVFFADFQNGRVGLAYVLVNGGEVHRFATPPEILRPAVADISRDGSELLIRSMMHFETEQSLWIVPSTGGSGRRLSNVVAHDAAWSPDRSTVLYASGQELYLIGSGGGNSRKLATLPGRAYWMRYAPNGAVVRFTLLDPKTRNTSLWEIAADGSNLHPVLSGWSKPSSECCGNWAADGSYYVFQSAHGGKPNIWGFYEPGFWGSKTHRPFEITAGPLDYLAPVPAASGNQLFCIGANTRRELFHFNPASQKGEPYLSKIRAAKRSELAHHSDRIAWISTTDGALWRGTEDGNERVQVTASPLSVYMARWSPDDRRLAVMGKRPGAPFQIYTVSADGGDLQVLLDEGRNQADPDWGPGGTSIVFGRLPDYAAEATAPKDIRILDLATKNVSVLPESKGMFSPRWSPDGRYIAAMPLDQRKLMVFDRTTGKWSSLAQGIIHNPVWSRDGKYLYFQDLLDDDVPISRVSIADRRLERICDRNLASTTDSIEFWGLAKDGGPVGSTVIWAADVYGLSWLPGTRK